MAQVAKEEDTSELVQQTQELHVSNEGLRLIDVTGKLMDQEFVAQIWLLSNALYVWLGTSSQNAQLSSMATAIETKFDAMPLASSVVGNSEMEELQMAQRLSKRTKRQCFVSCQVPDGQPELRSYIERQVLDKLREENVLVK